MNLVTMKSSFLLLASIIFAQNLVTALPSSLDTHLDLISGYGDGNLLASHHAARADDPKCDKCRIVS
jgi:hypothetical protein